MTERRPARPGQANRKAVSAVDQTAELLRTYLRVTQHLSQHFREYFGQYNLTFPQAMVLTVLGEEGTMPISALAERTGSANSTISGVVDRLEKLDLAKRIRSTQDRRVIFVEATPRYQKLKEQALDSVNDYFSTLVQGISPKEREEILRALTTLDKVLTAEKEQKD